MCNIRITFFPFHQILVAFDDQLELKNKSTIFTIKHKHKEKKAWGYND